MLTLLTGTIMKWQECKEQFLDLVQVSQAGCWLVEIVIFPLKPIQHFGFVYYSLWCDFGVDINHGLTAQDCCQFIHSFQIPKTGLWILQIFKPCNLLVYKTLLQTGEKFMLNIGMSKTRDKLLKSCSQPRPIFCKTVRSWTLNGLQWLS